MRSVRLLRPADVGSGFRPVGCYVYVMWGRDSSVTPLYVGQSANLTSRLRTHLADPDKRALIDRIEIIACLDADDMAVTEQDQIHLLKPFFNVAGADGVLQIGRGWGGAT